MTLRRPTSFRRTSSHRIWGCCTNTPLRGEESSRNVFYTGAAPNQQAIPAVEYFLEELGVEKFALLGTDYVYPRTTNNVLERYLSMAAE